MGFFLRHKFISLALILLFAGIAFGSKQIPKQSTLTPVKVNTTNAICRFRDQGALPDPDCTPGALNPNVSQSNIAQTICVHGYTKTIRPSLSESTQLKHQLFTNYGVTGQKGELDHLIPLELGGDPRDIANLWAEIGPIPNPKDNVENELKARVCAGSMTLAAAQAAIRSDWRKAL